MRKRRILLATRITRGLVAAARALLLLRKAACMNLRDIPEIIVRNNGTVK